MRTALNVLTASERQQIEAAIGAAEEPTSAEIVCAIATESGRYDRAEAVVGLFTGLLLLLLLNLTAPVVAQQLARPGNWDTPAFTFAFVEQACAVLAGFLLGNVLASYWRGLRRLFVGRAHLEAEAQRSAAYVFATRRLASTRRAGGVLIYISLFEHRVIVLADAGVMEKLGQAFLDELRDVAVKDLQSGKLVAMFDDTLALAAMKLSVALPRERGDENELPNALVLIHPRP